MKRFFIVVTLLVVAAIGFYLINRPAPERLFMSGNQATNLVANPQVPVQPANTNGVNVASSAANSNAVSISTPTPFVPPASSSNPIEATNLTQWKSIIPELRAYDRFEHEKFGSESWVMEQTNREMGIPILLEQNEKKVPYKVRFIDVRAGLPDGKIQRVEIHSPIMNIDETRELGLKLAGLLGIESTEFTDWCAKVGNHWLDAPLYSSKSGNHLGFETLMTYNDEKPWYVNFVIANP